MVQRRENPQKPTTRKFVGPFLTQTSPTALPLIEQSPTATTIAATGYTDPFWEGMRPFILQLTLENMSLVIQQPAAMQSVATEENTEVDEDEWTLTAEQMVFMFQNHNMIEDASSEEDLELVRELAASEEFTSLFGEMGIDEAWDRYITTIEEGRA